MNLKNLSNRELADSLLGIVEIARDKVVKDILREAAERLKNMDNVVDDGR